MNTIPALIPIAAITLIVIYSGWQAVHSTQDETQPDVLSEQHESESDPSPEHTPTDVPEPATPTNKPLPTNTPVPPTATSQPVSSGDWQYPGASVTNQSGTTMTLTSSDNADTITDWYASKMSERNYNATSNVRTSSNDTINNVLAGAKSGEEIKIEITKPSGDNTVTIRVIQ